MRHVLRHVVLRVSWVFVNRDTKAKSVLTVQGERTPDVYPQDLADRIFYAERKRGRRATVRE